MLALDFLRVTFAWAVLFRLEMTCVGAPMIGIIAPDPKRLQQRFEPQKHVVFAATKDVGQDLAGVVIDSMPEPTRVAFVPDERPHLIHLRLRFPSALYVPGHLGGVQCVQYSGVHRLQHGFFPLECTQHRVGTDMQRPRRIAHPAGVETHVDNGLLHFWQAPAVAIVEQETPLGTAGVLTEVALGTPGRFAAFDNLVTLTVQAADSNERHGPFLPKGGYEDEAQCDIHRSPSPLWKHYHLFYDAPHRRLYIAGGAGALSIVAQEDADHYTPVATIPTAAGARTALFVPALDRLYLAVPRRGTQGAEIRVYAIP